MPARARPDAPAHPLGTAEGTSRTKGLTGRTRDGMGLPALRRHGADRYVKKVDCARLAAAIANRLEATLPETVRLEVDGPSISTVGPDGWYGGYDLDQLLSCDEDDDWSQMELWVHNVLSGVQDDVAHATRGMAWPPGAARPSEALAMPWAHVRNNELHLGYGEMALSPIPLRDIHSQK